MICLSIFIAVLFPFFGLKAATIISNSTHISEDTIWTTDNSPYIIQGRIIINTGATLTIEPGVIIKFKPRSGAQIQIQGNLKAEGKEDAKIVFTSLADDDYAGDTNNDGSLTSPVPGEWNGLSFISTSNVGTLDNVIVAYGGWRPGIVAGSVEAVSNNNLIITNSEIRNSGNYGILLYYSQARLENSKIINNKVGIVNWESYGSIIKNNIIADNNSGIMTCNAFFAKAIDATLNWWGDPSGPYHPTLNPNGKGNKVGDAVLFDPWLDKEPQAEIEIDPLILKYEPILYFHPAEDFHPMNVESFVNNSSLWDSKGIDPDQEIKAESDENPVNLNDLTPPDQDTANWYLQFSQDLQDKTPDPEKAKTEYQALISPAGEAKNTYYARKMEDSYTNDQGAVREFTVLQYWYFYAFNDFGAKVEKGNNHEGDWESVMVFLDKDTEEPQFVAYSAHHNVGEGNLLVGSFDSVRRNWDSDEVVKKIVEGEDKIVSFVGLGSHANYPNNGKSGIHDIPFFADDVTSFDGVHLGIESNLWSEGNIFIFSDDGLPVWLTDYKGKWGVDYLYDLPVIFEGQSGPQGPFQQDKFNQPIKWAGIDKIKEQQLQTGENIIETDTAVLTVITNEQGQITIDYHNEIPPFGESEVHILFPHFWDITSNLANGEFETEVSFIYNPEEMQSLGIANLTKLTIFVYDETGQIWQEVPSAVDINNNIIKFQTDHFSRYAIGVKKIQFQDITDKVKIVEDKKHYDKKTGIQEIDFKIKNDTKEELKGMLLLSIGDLEKGVEFVSPDDLSSLSLISAGLPENLSAVNFTDAYNYCLFTGTESDIPGTIDKGTKNKLLKEKPIKDKKCSEISSEYSELILFLEDVLPAHKFTQDKTLRFKVPSKMEKKFDYKVRVWGEVGIEAS